MAREEALISISVEAASNLSASQYRFMRVNASGKLAAPTAGQSVDGVLQDKPDADGAVGLLGILGASKITCGAAVTAGDELTPGTAGKAVTAGTSDVVAGKALADGSGDGSIIPMLLTPQKEPLT